MNPCYHVNVPTCISGVSVLQPFPCVGCQCWLLSSAAMAAAAALAVKGMRQLETGTCAVKFSWLVCDRCSDSLLTLGLKPNVWVAGRTASWFTCRPCTLKLCGGTTLSGPVRGRNRCVPQPLQLASGAEISRLIKTLTSDNVRDMARKLGKSSHSHPLLFAEKVLNQLERCGWQQRRRSEAVG